MGKFLDDTNYWNWHKKKQVIWIDLYNKWTDWISIQKITNWGSSGQDGGVGRDPLLPPTTKRRITTNLKSMNNQKRQKIKLHGTPTTKELKRKSIRTTRRVRLQTVWANSEKPRWCSRPWGRDWQLRGKLRLIVGYSWGCCSESFSHSHIRVHWEVRYRQAGELHSSLSSPSTKGSATVQQGQLPCPGEYLRPCPLKTY